MWDQAVVAAECLLLMNDWLGNSVLLLASELLVGNIVLFVISVGNVI